jgi:type-F conjugative transfer system mating-pair stabilization protein TraN
VGANQAIADPQKTLDEHISESTSSEIISEETKTCIESGDEYSQSCSKQLQIKLKITPEVKRSITYCPGHSKEQWQWHGFNSGYITVYYSCGGCATRADVTPKKVEVISEKWIDDCVHLENLVEQGLCRYVSATRSPKNETRTIQSELITRDHFEEHYVYACFKASSQSCKGLREIGCYQTSSLCKEKVGNTCVLWEQTYKCPSRKRGLTSRQSSNNENPFCLSGNCSDTSYEANQDLFQVISQLSVLKEAQNDLRRFATIFKGTDRRCTRNCLDFRDCCGSGKGWGVSLKLSSCDAEEKELRELRDKNRCVMVGTYCAEKIGGQCIRKRTTFCCYGSKLAKIIQEQGKGQLGLVFGAPEYPQCQGLTPEQLSRMDFSKVNFSDLFQDIAASTKAPNVQKITESIQKSMKDKTSHITNSQKIQGRSNDDF